MQRNALALAVASACLMLGALDARAAGFALHEQGISGLGNAYAGAAAVDVATAIAAVARNSLRIMSLPTRIKSAFAPLQPARGLRKPEHQPFVERAASMASP